MPALCSHDLHHTVVVVPSCGMHWHAGGLVDDNHTLVFVHDADGLCGDRRLVSMQGMADYIAVLHMRVDRLKWLAVDLDLACLYGIFLKALVRYPCLQYHIVQHT